MTDIEKAREIFLTDVDEDTKQDNLARIEEWEQGLIENMAYASWEAHDITLKVVEKAMETYKEASLTLALNRDLTEEQRYSFYAKQDAALWLVSLCKTGAVENIKRIQSEIRHALRAA